MNKTQKQEKAKELFFSLFSSSNWIYPIIFLQDERKVKNSLKLLTLKTKIYNLEFDIKKHLFSFSRLIEEELWNTVFTYLIIHFLDGIFFEFKKRNKTMIITFKDVCWTTLHFYKDKEDYSKLRKKIIDQIIDGNKVTKNQKKLFDLEKFNFDNLINSLFRKDKINLSYLSKYPKESKIAELLLSFPWYRDYLEFIWTFEKIDWKFDTKTILKLFLLNDLNIPKKSNFFEINEFVEQYGGWQTSESEKNILKLLEILGFVFNKIKSNSGFGNIIYILKNLKEEQISDYFQKWEQKLPFPEKKFFLKQNITFKQFEDIIDFSKNLRNFASHTQNWTKFTTKNSKTPIEYMLYILEKIEFSDDKTLLDFRFILKNHLDQIYNFYKMGVFNNVFDCYSSKDLLKDIKNLFLGKKGSKHFLLNLNQEEQIEYDKKYD